MKLTDSGFHDSFIGSLGSHLTNISENPSNGEKQEDKDKPQQRSSSGFQFTKLYSTLDLCDETQSLETSSNLAKEFNLYILEPVERYKACTPLSFWKQNQTRFPILSFMSCDIFCVMASTGGLERDFSVASLILSARRNRMKPDLFEKLLFSSLNKGVA